MTDMVADAVSDSSEIWFDGNAKLLTDGEAQLCYESHRIKQVLMAAGVDPHMLNGADRARVLTALMRDNVVFEDGNVISAMRGGIGGISDAIRLTDEETNARGNLVALLYWNGKKIKNGEPIDEEIKAFKKATPDTGPVNISFGMARDVPNYDEFGLGSLMAGSILAVESGSPSINVAETPDVPGFEKETTTADLPPLPGRKN